MKRTRRRRKYRKVPTIVNNKDLIDRSKNKHLGAYIYTKTKYTNSSDKVIVKCKLHGEFKITPKRLLARRGGCPKCKSVSNGEIKTTLYLIANKIKYIPEYTIAGTRWRYDFYLPDLAIVIEYDGIQHFKSVRKFGGKKTLADTMQRDKDKDLLAELNGLKMIRISYTKYDMLEEYLSYRISCVYKYRAASKFYKTFNELCKALNLPGDTKPSDVKSYLTYVRDQQ